MVITSNRGRCCCPPVKLVAWCAREDLNLHAFRHQILSLACLPFHHARNLDYQLTATVFESGLTFAAKPTPRGRFRKTPSSPPRLSTFNLWMLPPACRAMKFSDGVALRCESANGMGKSINSDVLTISAESASGQTFICFFRCRHGGFYQGVEAENVCVTTCRSRARQFLSLIHI